MTDNVELLHEHLTRIASEDPTRVAIRAANGNISYASLLSLVDRFCDFLLKKNINKGDRIAFLSPPSTDFWVAFLGASSLGAIFVGLNPKHTLNELKYVIADAAPKALFGRKEVRGRSFSKDFLSLQQEYHFIQSIELFDDFTDLLPIASPQDLHKPTIQYDDPCAIIYTSGSTGAPKGALIPHGGLAECCQIQSQVIGLECPIALNNLPINHIGCLGDICGFALAAGGSIVFQEKFDPKGVLDLIEQHKINWWGQIPTMFQLALDKQVQQPRDLSSIQRIFTSGAPASPALLKRLRSICPAIQNGYGMTETVGSITWVKDGDDEVICNTIGKPVPPYQVRIADETGKIAIKGASGEIQAKGRMHMLGYWNRQEASRAACTPDGWLRTGDLARELPDGNYKLVGRLSDTFKSGGYNVYPREIELALETMPGITTAVVVSIPDDVFHEIGHAFLLFEADCKLETTDILSHLQVKLANYKIPKAFSAIPHFPQLPNGKIDRKALATKALEAISNI